MGFALLLLWQPLAEPVQNKVLAVACWMVLWWVLEVFPIYITAMLPMVLFPSLGVFSLTDTFAPYASPIVFLFLGGFLIALALEEHQLHKRIAYGLIRLTGTNPRGIVLGFMLATALVAMWISNTATAVMMLPIGLSVIDLIRVEVSDEKFVRRFSLVLMLSIAYAANIGGTATLIGTPPNLVFAGYYFEAFGREFGFAEWLVIGIPVALLMLATAYLLLVHVLFPIRAQQLDGVAELFEQRWRALGPMSKAEQLTLAVFSLTVLCWISLGPINDLLGFKLLNNTNVALGGGLLMFFTPLDWKRGQFLLHWESTTRLPWGILILFGGGLALAAGMESVGLIDKVANAVGGISGGHMIWLCIALTLLSIFMTELMSNVALVTVLLPVVFSIAELNGANALLLTIPVTLAASCAFMMPISTPPNAIVYSSGYITVPQMMKAGVWMNLVAGLIIVLVSYLVLG